MKMLLSLSALFVSLTTLAANQPLMLDAACKVTCLVSSTEVQNDQGFPSLDNSYESTFVDFINLSRQQIEAKLQSTEFKKVCQKTFNDKASNASVDCLYFKH